MSRLLWCITCVALFFATVIFSGCGGVPSSSGFQLTAEEKALLRRYSLREDRVVRWPDGYVDVYDATEQANLVQEALNYWNAAIGVQWCSA